MVVVAEKKEQEMGGIHHPMLPTQKKGDGQKTRPPSRVHQKGLMTWTAKGNLGVMGLRNGGGGGGVVRTSPLGGGEVG